MNLQIETIQDENKNSNYKEFIKSHKAVLIPLSEIRLKEKVHTKAKVDFENEIRLIKKSGVTEINNTIIIKKEANGYSLIQGYRAYTLSKQLNQQNIKAIIIKENRMQFVSKYVVQNAIISTEEIKIPDRFQQSKPSQEKFNMFLSRYLRDGKLDKPIGIDRNGVLRDGYIRLIIAKFVGLCEVPVLYV